MFYAIADEPGTVAELDESNNTGFVGLTVDRWNITGDVTGDCKVNILDMIAIRNHLNEVVDPGNEIYDVTGDNKINILDMILVRNHLNDTCE